MIKFLNVRISDHTNGRTRFAIGKLSGFVALRKVKSRGFGIEDQRCFKQLHLWKISIALEKSKAERDLWNFAGN